jgi:hypothetical protein
MNDWIPFDNCHPLEASSVNWPWAIDFLSPAMRPESGVAPDRVLFCPPEHPPLTFLYSWSDRNLVIALLVSHPYPYVGLVPDEQNPWLWDLWEPWDRSCRTDRPTTPPGAERPCVPFEFEP